MTIDPEKSRDCSFKNPGILADVKSRDPGIPGIPLGPASDSGVIGDSNDSNVSGESGDFGDSSKYGESGDSEKFGMSGISGHSCESSGSGDFVFLVNLKIHVNLVILLNSSDSGVNCYSNDSG